MRGRAALRARRNVNVVAKGTRSGRPSWRARKMGIAAGRRRKPRRKGRLVRTTPCPTGPRVAGLQRSAVRGVRPKRDENEPVGKPVGREQAKVQGDSLDVMWIGRPPGCLSKTRNMSSIVTRVSRTALGPPSPSQGIHGKSVRTAYLRREERVLERGARQSSRAPAPAPRSTRVEAHHHEHHPRAPVRPRPFRPARLPALRPDLQRPTFRPQPPVPRREICSFRPDRDLAPR